MKIKDMEIAESHEVTELARAKEIGVGRILLQVVEKRRDEIRKVHEMQLAKSDTDLRNMVAQINALNWVLSIPTLAQDYINKQEK